MKKDERFGLLRLTSTVLILAATLLSVAGCARRAMRTSDAPVNAAPSKPVVRTPETERQKLLPLITTWFENHDQRNASALADDDRLIINIPGLKISPAIDKVAKDFAIAWRGKLTELRFANDFTLRDPGTKTSKTYQLKSIDVVARETALKAVDLFFISQKKIKTISSLDAADDSKLIVMSPAFNEDNHLTSTIEFLVKEGKAMRSLGFNETYTVTNGRESWTQKLY